MAKVYKSEEAPSLGIVKIVAGLALIFGGIFIGFAMFSHSGNVFSAVIPVALIILGGYVYANGRKRFAGTWGEMSTANKLSELPESYRVFRNVHVHNKMEADAVVVGENGVFIVETKSYNGRVEGRKEDNNWYLHKVGRRGGRYSKKIANPFRQLKRNIFIVSNFLKMRNCKVWVDGCISFSNSSTTFGTKPGFFEAIFSPFGLSDNEEPEEKCFRGNEVINFILNYHPRRKLTTTDIEKISSALHDCLHEAPPYTADEFNQLIPSNAAR